VLGIEAFTTNLVDVLLAILAAPTTITAGAATAGPHR